MITPNIKKQSFPFVFKTLSHYQLYLIGLPPLHVYQETSHDNQERTDEIDNGVGKCHLFRCFEAANPSTGHLIA